jgi:hypothetical protein
MRAEVPGGGTRLDAAKSAARTLIGGLAPETGLQVIAYGHQSPREARDCADIAEIAPMTAVSAGAAAAVAAVAGLQARGYTPITASLQRAADGLRGGAPTIILVSDGKETCEGDPCAAARAIARANASVVIHTIGLGVDEATRGQLQCVAAEGRGSYHDASNAGDLAAALASAAEEGPKAPTVQTLTLKKPGTLAVKAPGGSLVTDGYSVRDAETGAAAGIIIGDDPLGLPAGIYAVTLGTQVWASVPVKAGEATVLQPATVRVAADGGIDTPELLDPETDQPVARLENSRATRALVLPGRYDLAFCGGTLKVPVVAEAGKETVFEAGVISLEGSFDGIVALNDAEGQRVCEFFDGFAQTQPIRTVPPGAYVLEILGQTLDIDARAGSVSIVNLE